MCSFPDRGFGGWASSCMSRTRGRSVAELDRSPGQVSDSTNYRSSGCSARCASASGNQARCPRQCPWAASEPGPLANRTRIPDRSMLKIPSWWERLKRAAHNTPMFGNACAFVRPQLWNKNHSGVEPTPAGPPAPRPSEATAQVASCSNIPPR